MSNIVPLVNIVHGKALATSLAVAEKFGKQHNNVLRDIRDLLKNEEINLPVFREITYTDASGRKYPMFEMDRDGFSLLAKGVGTDAPGRKT